MREIEIKLRAKNLTTIEEKLSEMGAVFLPPIDQRDVVYSKGGSTAEWQEASEGHIVLRIRRQNDRSIFTLKQQRSSESDNIEHETEISDPDALDAALKMIGWEPEVEVVKIRRKGKLGEYELCLDEVQELGFFLEVEKLTEENTDPEKVREELFALIEPLGLTQSDEELHGYDTLIFKLQHSK